MDIETKIDEILDKYTVVGVNSSYDEKDNLHEDILNLIEELKNS